MYIHTLESNELLKVFNRTTLTVNFLNKSPPQLVPIKHSRIVKRCFSMKASPTLLSDFWENHPANSGDSEVYAYIHLYLCRYLHISISIYIYIYSYTHTYMYIYI